MTTSAYDAIVVGSGITGGWAAKELTERGLRVLMLERGKPIEHRTDYTGEHKPPWEFRFRTKGDRKQNDSHYPIQKNVYAFNDANRHFWVRDDEVPYQTDDDAPFMWLRADCLGGRSLLWGRQVYRWSDLDFEANAKDGHGVDWPIRYADVAPWYDHVEEFIGVSGQAEGLPQLPDGKFMPAMAMTCAETYMKDKVEAAFPDRRMTIGRVAVITRDHHHGRKACHYCGPCHHGCSTGSYFSTQSSTLPAALATGRLDVRTHTIVEKVEVDPKTGRATGVHVIDAQTHERAFLSARLVFLCASTVATTQILLHSASERAPDGLANSSGALGRYLMDHTYGSGAIGVLPQVPGEYSSGHRPNGTYIPRFRNVGEDEADFVRGYGFQGQGMRAGWAMSLTQPGFGAEFKESLTKPGPWMMFLGGFGECLPRAVNRITLSKDQHDKWGMTQLHVRFEWGDNERAIVKDLLVEAQAMLAAAGAVHVVPFGDEPAAGGLGIHEMGTARMGRDPRTSVLNAHNQTHDVPNLFVTDGSAMTSSACQNPSLTYMALTARACAYAAAEVESGAL